MIVTSSSVLTVIDWEIIMEVSLLFSIYTKNEAQTKVSLYKCKTLIWNWVKLKPAIVRMQSHSKLIHLNEITWLDNRVDCSDNNLWPQQKLWVGDHWQNF